MDRQTLLTKMLFGAQVAELETDALASYFLETHQWSRISRGEVDIIRGEKGSGKSAIYLLLMDRADEFFDDNIFLVAAENPRGATVFTGLIADPPASEPEFTFMWKLYIITIVAQRIKEYGIKNSHADSVYQILEDSGLLEREFSLMSVLRNIRDYARRVFNAEAVEGGLTIDPATQLPTGITGRIVLGEPSRDLRDRGLLSADALFAELDAALEPDGFKVWVLLDRLDVAFADSHALEARALRTLFKVYSDISQLPNISLKIFLRDDIWKRIHIWRNARSQSSCEGRDARMECSIIVKSCNASHPQQ